ncbi:MAG: tol-pal system-associated acyl-CoA thioesterase [Piscirickettsiaceae bacterium]|nr:MAG: tol-pal system-associated acyl-CoA thioesterase [Piscirickettsiaceae bacterium]PCI70623.1 MAG: tol-pal system-associated acyl-CoA thioesterase [Piscirickettsiaceae bacterium]
MQQRIHQWPIRIYYEDTDMQGIVYYANYLKYFERARTEFLRSKGFEQGALIKEHRVAFAVRSVQVEYIKPATFNDELIVTTTVAKLKRASLIFEQTIVRATANHETINTAVIKVACLDAQSMKVKAIPTLMIEQLS